MESGRNDRPRLLLGLFCTSERRCLEWGGQRPRNRRERNAAERCRFLAQRHGADAAGTQSELPGSGGDGDEQRRADRWREPGAEPRRPRHPSRVHMGQRCEPRSRSSLRELSVPRTARLSMRPDVGDTHQQRRAGGWLATDSIAQQHGVLWPASGPARDLGVNAWPIRINDAGDISGYGPDVAGGDGYFWHNGSRGEFGSLGGGGSKGGGIEEKGRGTRKGLTARRKAT